ncbi:MAG: carbon-nitrogen family hydrolase [Anaerolineales bacterium]
MRNLTVSLGQMDISLGDVAANFGQVRAWTAEAASRGSGLVLFPELWSTGCDWEHLDELATPLGAGIFADISDLAAEFRLAVGGSVLERHEGKFYNTFVLYGPNGGLLGVYRKLHLFRLMQEDQWLAAGDETALIETPWGQTGLAICYDLRFAELFRLYALGGAELALLPAEWPEVRVAHWRTLVRARAIENQMFVAAVNRVGASQGETFGGRSALVDPWGNILVEGGAGPELLTAEIDLGMVAHVRNKIPVFADRRHDIYGM